jgi:MFS family permease
MVGLGPTHANYMVHLLAPMVMFGLGGGLSFPALTMIAMADIAPADAGLASGLLNTTGQVGGAFGLAVLATIAGGRTAALIGGGIDGTAALAGGYHFAWLVGAGVVVVTLVVAALTLRTRKMIVVPQIDVDCAECEVAA